MPEPMPQASPLDDSAYLSVLRAQMLKFARLQLSHAEQAEDAVQEALLGAMRNAASFANRAAVKTWVFGILKHKIADALRDRQKQQVIGQPLHEDDSVEDYSDEFTARGHWRADAVPAVWGNPQQSAQDRQFWAIFEACLEHLPEQQSRAFMMREFVELDSHEICATLGITMTNLNVTLYRARLHLRRCLEQKWFVPGGRA